MLKIATLALAIVSAGIIASPAFANPGSDADQQACTPDVFRLCSSEIPNVSRITACLIKNKAKLSPACKAVFDRKK